MDGSTPLCACRVCGGARVVCFLLFDIVDLEGKRGRRRLVVKEPTFAAVLSFFWNPLGVSGLALAGLGAPDLRYVQQPR